jgi:hypothetical protein
VHYLQSEITISKSTNPIVPLEAKSAWLPLAVVVQHYSHFVQELAVPSLTVPVLQSQASQPLSMMESLVVSADQLREAVE